MYDFHAISIPVTLCFYSFEMQQNYLQSKTNLLNINDWPCLYQQFSLLDCENDVEEFSN